MFMNYYEHGMFLRHGKRLTFQARVVKKFNDFIVLREIVDFLTGELVSNQENISLTKDLEKLDLIPNSIIQFEARVTRVSGGVFTLSRPTKCRIIS